MTLEIQEIIQIKQDMKAFAGPLFMGAGQHSL